MVVGRLFHVDKVNDDQPGEVAHPQLLGDFVGSFQIGFQRGFLNVHFAGGAAGVDVYGYQRFGRVNHKIAAGCELNYRIVQLVQLLFDLIMLEDGDFARFAAFYLASHVRRENLAEFLGGLIGIVAVDDNFADIFGVHIAQGTLNQVALFINQCRRLGAQRRVADVVPGADKIIVVADDVALLFVFAGSADNQRHIVVQRQFAHNVFKAFAVVGRGDFAGNAAGFDAVGH